MSQQTDYNINMDVMHEHFELIDVPSIVKNCTKKWFNQVLTEVNDSVVRIGIVEGEFHWHKHDTEDEFFFVLEGQLFVDTEEKIFTLNPGQGITVSKGVVHRTRAPKKTVMLMVELNTIRPVGD